MRPGPWDPKESFLEGALWKLESELFRNQKVAQGCRHLKNQSYMAATLAGGIGWLFCSITDIIRPFFSVGTRVTQSSTCDNVSDLSRSNQSWEKGPRFRNRGSSILSNSLPFPTVGNMQWGHNPKRAGALKMNPLWPSPLTWGSGALAHLPQRYERGRPGHSLMSACH